METKAKWCSLLLAMSAATTCIGAQSSAPDALEDAYWRCDYAATQGLLDVGTAMDCSVVVESLKARRFGGDFSAMLAWWRANKEARYLALSVAPAQRPAPALR